eukprot:CAMPEP_0202694880 /NCGR_PEP_ID=MMETSP1385-20130828/8618_1 /ASSEMBLY_ACC=CAM_ASM_000861 /TAXON_ID=933848 /ORGANISM="Elphidium margaritaceum" /LENGTH=284 /DNA_ID=CAMNT_0049350807 /DNA_START=29 /DNA_END=883 /DNA_ORIENTATION=-
MSYRDTTVLTLKDFRITSLPTIPSGLNGRVDINIWNQFTVQCQQRIHDTFTSNEPGIDLDTLASKRRCYQMTYWICAPLTCVFGYVGYYCLVLSATLGTAILLLGALFVLGAFVCLASSATTATKVRSLMQRYRRACQQDLSNIFWHFNEQPDSMIHLSQARSTHRNNGTVQLGILVSLKTGHTGVGTNTLPTNGTMYQQPANVMPIQIQQMNAKPVQLPNGQVVYQVIEPAQPPPPYNQGYQAVQVLAAPMLNEGVEGIPLNAANPQQQQTGQGETIGFDQYQ